jgi:DNA-binding GntR family transcriptional regulator
MKTNESLKNQIYNAILNGIFSGEFKPGQILNERELVERFGCSKAPVREALIALCSDDILRSFPRYGYEIVRLTSEHVEEILNYRLILETGYLRSCYQNLTKLQLNELTRIADRCLSQDADMWEHWEANTDFHLTLLSFSRNRYACEQLEKSMSILKRAYAQFYWQTWNQSIPVIDVQHHHPIIRSLEEKNIEQAVCLLEEDLKDFCFY